MRLRTSFPGLATLLIRTFPRPWCKIAHRSTVWQPAGSRLPGRPHQAPSRTRWQRHPPLHPPPQPSPNIPLRNPPSNIPFRSIPSEIPLRNYPSSRWSGSLQCAPAQQLPRRCRPSGCSILGLCRMIPTAEGSGTEYPEHPVDSLQSLHFRKSYP